MATESDIKSIRDWLLRKPQLPQTLDNHFLDNFLVFCDGDLERTKTSLELFFTFRTDCPEIFRNRDPLAPEIQHVFNSTEVFPLPELTPEGYACVLFRFVDPDPDQFHFYDFVKTFFMVGDVRARLETTLVKGLVTILDLTGWSLRHITKCSIFSVRKYIKYCQDVQPVKLKQIHVVNSVPLFDKVFSFIKPFVNGDIISVVHVHPVGSEKLDEFIPKAMLPAEYGGAAGTMQEIKEAFKKKVEAEREWFLKDEWMLNATEPDDQDLQDNNGFFSF